jgi:hypothetical protein
MDKATADRLVDAARESLSKNSVSEFVEVDDVDAADLREAFSEGDDGTWVRAWVFVSKDEVPT